MYTTARTHTSGGRLTGSHECSSLFYAALCLYIFSRSLRSIATACASLTSVSAHSNASKSSPLQLDAAQPPDETWVVLGGPCSLHDVGALERDVAPQELLNVMSNLLKRKGSVWRVGGILGMVLDGVASAENVGTV